MTEKPRLGVTINVCMYVIEDEIGLFPVYFDPNCNIIFLQKFIDVFIRTLRIATNIKYVHRMIFIYMHPFGWLTWLILCQRVFKATDKLTSIYWITCQVLWFLVYPTILYYFLLWTSKFYSFILFWHSRDGERKFRWHKRD